MTTTSIVFGLETGSYDSEHEDDAGSETLLVTPIISVFASAADAAASEEGIDIVEGDLHFFAADGSPMEAVFSKEPEIDLAKKKYFPGIYTLRAGKGDTLQQVLVDISAENPSPHMQIVVNAPGSDELAKTYGWKTAKAMQQDIEQALKILSPDMAKRVVFDRD